MARTLYDVMMISPEADRQLITVVYRHLAKRYHPDKDASPAAAARMAELNDRIALVHQELGQHTGDNQARQQQADLQEPRAKSGLAGDE